MAYGYKWRPSKSDARDFYETMQEIKAYCEENLIDHSGDYDSYYFSINDQPYRVSNHSVEASDAGAWREMSNGEVIKVREEYHNGRELDTIYIHAGKTRIIGIHKALLAGIALDGRGNPKSGSRP